jgi:hypothetical protein
MLYKMSTDILRNIQNVSRRFVYFFRFEIILLPTICMLYKLSTANLSQNDRK